MFSAVIVAAATSAMHCAIAQFHADQAEAVRMREIGMSEEAIFLVFEQRRLAEKERLALLEAADRARPRGIGIFW